MNDKELRELFESSDSVESSEIMRQKAIDAALDEFDTVQGESDRQGNTDLTRPTPDIIKFDGRKRMIATTRRWLYSGLATAAVMILSVSLVLNMDTGVEILPTQWQDAIVFVILLVFLIVRPQGFFGKTLRRAAV